MFHVTILCKEKLPIRHLDRSGEISYFCISKSNVSKIHIEINFPNKKTTEFSRYDKNNPKPIIISSFAIE